MQPGQQGWPGQSSGARQKRIRQGWVTVWYMWVSVLTNQGLPGVSPPMSPSLSYTAIYSDFLVDDSGMVGG